MSGRLGARGDLRDPLAGEPRQLRHVRGAFTPFIASFDEQRAHLSVGAVECLLRTRALLRSCLQPLVELIHEAHSAMRERAHATRTRLVVANDLRERYSQLRDRETAAPEPP